MFDVKVKDVMTTLVVTMKSEDPIHEAASRLARNRISGGPVVRDGVVVGVVSEADLIRAVMPPVPIDRKASALEAIGLLFRAKPLVQAHGKTVADVMNPTVISIGPDESIWTAATIMDHRGVKRLPVVDHEGFLLGIITRADLVQAMARSDGEIRADVEDVVEMVGSDTVRDLDVQVDDGVVRLSGSTDRSSTHGLIVKLASHVPGVIEVVDRLEHVSDDTKHPHQPVHIDPRENWNADIAVVEGRR